MFTCFQPIKLKVETNYHFVPCGKCPYCLNRRVNAWAFRLAQEEKYSFTAYFITLTYEDKNIKGSENGFQNLIKSDFQNFMKRLRKYEETNGNQQKITYYACGEYGSKTHRPHYHAIIFNATEKGIKHAWKNPEDGEPLGNVHFGNVTEASAKYTVKYLSKIKKIPMFEGDDRQKEFSLMSKGIGKKYLTENMINWHKQDIINHAHLTNKGGIIQPMPRYYKDKIYTKEERYMLKEHHTQKVSEELKELAESAKVNEIYLNRKKAEKQSWERMNLQENKRN